MTGGPKDPPGNNTAPRLRTERAEVERGCDAQIEGSGSGPEIETLYCVRSTTSSCVECWCNRCGRWHQHGMPYELGDGPTERVAHCAEMGSYLLVVDPVRARALAERAELVKKLATVDRRLARLVKP